MYYHDDVSEQETGRNRKRRCTAVLPRYSKLQTPNGFCRMENKSVVTYGYNPLPFTLYNVLYILFVLFIMLRLLSSQTVSCANRGQHVIIEYYIIIASPAHWKNNGTNQNVEKPTFNVPLYSYVIYFFCVKLIYLYYFILIWLEEYCRVSQHI